jgi:rare lipoprotein A
MDADRVQLGPAPPLTTIASWYDYEINGKPWSRKNATCASRDFPRETRLLITNVANEKRIVCRVNDYIMHPERGIDLSSYAFSKIASLGRGLITVRIERMGRIDE